MAEGDADGRTLCPTELEQMAERGTDRAQVGTPSPRRVPKTKSDTPLPFSRPRNGGILKPSENIFFFNSYGKPTPLLYFSF